VSRFGLGIDVGGTKIAAGVVDHDTGEIVERAVVPAAPERGGRAVLDDAIALAKQFRRPIASIGIGVPEIVDPAGVVRTNAVIDWLDLPYQREFDAIAPAVVEADVRAAALAEACFGAGVGRTSFVYVTLGTGISSTVVQDGKPWPGARGGALVMASMPLDVTCGHCGERTSIVLEEYAGGPAIARRYSNATGIAVPGALDVVNAAAAGDADAAEILKSAGREIGVSVAFLINVIDPEAIVIGGGLGGAEGVFREALIASTREHIWYAAARDLPIERAHFGAESGIIGAALAAER
jgi:glucokinase